MLHLDYTLQVAGVYAVMVGLPLGVLFRVDFNLHDG
jgi:hypothetical protein